MIDSRFTQTSGFGGPQSPPITAKIVVVGGPDEGLEVPLDDVVELGTDPACSLVLHDPKVSRRHASIRVAGGRILVKDLGSRSGTLLGGTRLLEADVPLGAVLMLGNTAIAIQPRWSVREVRPSNAFEFGDLSGESITK